MEPRFSKPGAMNAEGYRHKDHKGHLVIAEAPIERQPVTTQHGEADVAVPHRLHCVDCAQLWNEPWIFGMVIVNQLTTGANADMLGRIGQGDAKAGRSAPWVLEDATEADEAVAVTYLDSLSESF